MLRSGQPMRALSGLRYYCCRGLCLWSVPLPGTGWRTMTHTPADCEEQGSNFCYDIGDCQCTVDSEGHERFL